jgi:hypothetical protein
MSTRRDKMPALQVPFWIPLTSPSTEASDSSEGGQQGNGNRRLVSIQLTPPTPQILLSEPQTKSISTQTENFDSPLLVQDTRQHSDNESDIRSVSSQAVSSCPAETTKFHIVPPKLITVTPSPDRTVKRSLKGIHIFVCH